MSFPSRPSAIGKVALSSIVHSFTITMKTSHLAQGCAPNATCGGAPEEFLRYHPLPDRNA